VLDIEVRGVANSVGHDHGVVLGAFHGVPSSTEIHTICMLMDYLVTYNLHV
jgi:hypothetical protein